jgi:hypothetical protein
MVVFERNSIVVFERHFVFKHNRCIWGFVVPGSLCSSWSRWWPPWHFKTVTAWLKSQPRFQLESGELRRPKILHLGIQRGSAMPSVRWIPRSELRSKHIPVNHRWSSMKLAIARRRVVALCLSSRNNRLSSSIRQRRIFAIMLGVLNLKMPSMMTTWKQITLPSCETIRWSQEHTSFLSFGGAVTHDAASVFWTDVTFEKMLRFSRPDFFRMLDAANLVKFSNPAGAMFESSFSYFFVTQLLHDLPCWFVGLCFLWKFQNRLQLGLWLMPGGRTSEGEFHVQVGTVAYFPASWEDLRDIPT